MPTRVKRSASIADLIFRSKGWSMLRDGDKFTSRTQGFKWLSIKMSNPYNSEMKKNTYKNDKNVMKTAETLFCC